MDFKINTKYRFEYIRLGDGRKESGIVLVKELKDNRIYGDYFYDNSAYGAELNTFVTYEDLKLFKMTFKEITETPKRKTRCIWY